MRLEYQNLLAQIQAVCQKDTLTEAQIAEGVKLVWKQNDLPPTLQNHDVLLHQLAALFYLYAPSLKSLWQMLANINIGSVMQGTRSWQELFEDLAALEEEEDVQADEEAKQHIESLHNWLTFSQEKIAMLINIAREQNGLSHQ